MSLFNMSNRDANRRSFLRPRQRNLWVIDTSVWAAGGPAAGELKAGVAQVPISISGR